MKIYFEYLLEANACLIVFMIFYFLFLRNETQFRVSRAYLLIALVAACVFPVVSIDFYETPKVIETITKNVSYQFYQESGTPKTDFAENKGWINASTIYSFITLTYWSGVILFFAHFVFQLFQLVRLIFNASSYKNGSYWVVESKIHAQTFSFFNFIFIGNTFSLTPCEKEQILAHEKIHVRQLHSIDMIVVSMLKIVFWFNPFISIYKKKLIQLHEYEADSRAVEDSELNGYCQLLARVALQTAGFPLANHFNDSLIFKRISMMQTIKKKINLLKATLLVLTFPIMFLTVACQKQEVDLANEQPTVIEKTKPKGQQEEYTIVEQVAEFDGGTEGWNKYLMTTIKYPEESRNNGIEGDITVRFEVNEDGKTDNVVIVTGQDRLCNEAVLKVISESPKWIPAKQYGLLVKMLYQQTLTFQIISNNSFKLVVSELIPINKKLSVSYTTEIINGKALVKGKVFDENNNPLPGTTIVWAGHSSGTTTDYNGKFGIELQDTSGDLAVSYVGYITEFIKY